MKDKLQRLVRRATCKHCGEVIRLGDDGLWVHIEPDEDPTVFDYKRVRCLPRRAFDTRYYAEPNSIVFTAGSNT